MPEASALKQWTDFYVIVGSSAGALTGLQFVVIALIAENESAPSMTQVRAFATPTIVHFCMVLLISAIATAPWTTASIAAVCLAVCGVAGVAYAMRVISHARRQDGYSPDFSDWAWYTAFPLSAYVTLLIGGVLLFWRPELALFVLAAAALALLFDGIHNAWDSITYIAVSRNRRKREKQ
jgi:hypothetical protein